MRTIEKRKSVKNGVARLIGVGIAVLLEVSIAFLIFLKLNDYAEWIAILTRVFGFLLILTIYSSDRTSTMKIPWIILIAITPFAGVFLYLLIGLNPNLMKNKRKYNQAHALYTSKLKQDCFIDDMENPYSLNISNYITKYSGYPLASVEKLNYYSNAIDGLQAQLEALSNAKKYIFMEYHAIENAESWAQIETILERKVKEGIEVRIIYDDMGSIGFVNTDFARHLRNKGIRCHVFNAFVPGLNIFLNNRDHRKITVVDGVIGFTGGYNLANEYFNITHPYGYWKDTGVMFTGKAVNNLTALFLEMWSLTDKGKEVIDESHYFVYDTNSQNTNGFIQVYGESPMVDERLAENTYIGMIESAKEYVWFVTPYLILTDEMIHALSLAAKRGVDVRIITPGIPDKRIIYTVTRSFYHTLCKKGVKIYEYTPGFSHCKMCISDDIRAICGTINLDYRSLYHHFEDACILYDTDIIQDMRNDFEDMFVASKDVSKEYTSGPNSILGFKQLLLRFIAQLL